MKTIKEINDRIIFFNTLLGDEDLNLITGSKQRERMRVKIETLKWVLNKKEEISEKKE